MDGRFDFSAEITDAVVEIFNISVNRAAAALSALGSTEVVLNVPTLDVVSRDTLPALLRQSCDGRISGIRQSFFGTIEGDALLLFPERESLELARSLVPNPDEIDDMTEMEREALLEVGNIVLNACIGSLADLIANEIDSSIPFLLGGEPEQLCATMISRGQSDLLLLRIDFQIQERSLGGYILFVLDLKAAGALRRAVEAIVLSFRDA